MKYVKYFEFTKLKNVNMEYGVYDICKTIGWTETNTKMWITNCWPMSDTMSL